MPPSHLLRRPRRQVVSLAAVAVVTAATLAVVTMTAPDSAAAPAPLTAFTVGQTLGPGQSLVSPFAGFTITMQPDGNLVETVTTSGTTVWQSGTAGRGASFAFRPGGDLAVLGPTGATVWSAGTAGTGADTLTITGNGALLVTAGGRTLVTKDPGLLPATSVVVGTLSVTASGRRFDLTVRPDGNAAVTRTNLGTGRTREVWATTVQSSGPAALVCDGSGNLALYEVATRRLTWSTQTAGTGPAKLSLTADGALALVNQTTGRTLWSTSVLPTPPTPPTSSPTTPPTSTPPTGAPPTSTPPTSTPPTTPPSTSPPPTSTPPTSTPVSLDLGQGFSVLSSPAADWVRANGSDPRVAAIAARIASRPSGRWLTSAGSVATARAVGQFALQTDTTATLVVYDIPLRNDGLTGASGAATAADYTAFVTQVAQAVGQARAVVVLEPDALWFVDRLTPPGTTKYTDRMTALNGAIAAFRTYAPRARVYLDAGTASGSVTATRMAQLLVAAGIRQAAGFAVNISSFAPTDRITTWAQSVRAALQTLGVADPRYVVDTSRNGNPVWDNTWCNPAGRLLGADPGAVGAASGLDFDVWIKQPGTSDGSCGVGMGTAGGQFMPDVATQMLGG